MKLHGLRLENFRQHASSEVFLPASGVIGVVGANESGKSSLLEAIAWALYGARATRGAKSGLRWNRAPARHVARVHLVFEVGGRTYHIDRTESDALLRLVSGSGAVIAEGTSAVDGHVPGLLGMGLAEFEASYMCRQKDLARLAGMGPTERRQFFLEVMGVGRVDEALAACRTRKNELRSERDGLAAGLGDGEALEAERQAAVEALEHARTARLGAQDAADEASGASEAQLALLARAEDARRRFEELRSALGRAESDATAAARERERALGQLAAAREAAERVAAAGGEGIAARLTEITQELGRLERERNQERSALELERAERRAAASATVQAKSAEASRAARKIAALEAAGPDGTCPTCTRALGDQYEQVLEALRDEGAAATSAAREATEQIHAWQRPADRERELATSTARERELAAEADQLKARDRELAEDRHRAARVFELVQEEGRRHVAAKAAREAADSLRANLAALDYDAEDHQRVAQAVTAAREAKAVADAELARTTEALRHAITRADRALVVVNDHRRRSATLEAVSARLQVHVAAAERLAAFRTVMAGEIRPELEELASGFVQLLTDGRHEAVAIDEDFAVTPYESGVPVPVVSGGTEDVVAIALRLAVSQMIAERAGHPLSLLILDEPFGSLDEVRRGNVLGLVRRLGGIFEQVLVISHVAETKDAVDHVIEVTYDEAAGQTRIVRRADPDLVNLEGAAA